jgi:hypothetical protein
MRKLTFLLIVSIIGLSPVQLANACGDKTMRVKTGLRFHQLQARKAPSTILIHSPALPPGKAAELRDFLNKVGHKATAIDDIGRVSNDLRTRHYDLVLTNLAEAPNLQKQVNSFTPKTVVVPVLLKPSKADVQAAKQYKVQVKNPTDGLDFLIAVNKAMKQSNKI